MNYSQEDRWPSQTRKMYLHKIGVFSDLCKSWIKAGSPGEAAVYAKLAATWAQKLQKFIERRAA